MKKIILIALVAVLCVGTAYASKLEVSGSAHYRGQTFHNTALLTDESKSASYYDFEMTIIPKFVVDENTYAVARFELADMTAGKLQGDGANATDNLDRNEADDNIWVEYAYFATKIGPTAVSTGLMSGGAWGTTFSDNVNPEWRIKTITTTPVGALVFVLRKAYEDDSVTGSGSTNDIDVYYLGFITKAGPLNIKPLLVFADYGSTVDSTGTDYGKMDKTAFVLAVDGTFGDIAVEFEFGYEDYKYDTAETLDNTLMGACLDVSMKMGDNNVGLVLGYASTDKSDAGINNAFSYGDERAYTVILDDEMELGSTQKAGMGGMTLVGLYGSFKAMDNLTVSPMFSYLMSNYDDNDGKVDMESAMELDICSAYKINDAVTYSFDLGYAQVQNITGDDPEDLWVIRHKLSISF